VENQDQLDLLVLEESQAHLVLLHSVVNKVSQVQLDLLDH